MASKTLNVCVLMFVATSMVLAASPLCMYDLEKTSAELGLAGTNMLYAEKDCFSNATQCTTDLRTALSHLGNATANITKAAIDCVGTSDVCTKDIENITAALANSTLDISAALKSCSSPVQAQCAKAVTLGGIGVGKVALFLVIGVKDCDTP